VLACDSRVEGRFPVRLVTRSRSSQLTPRIFSMDPLVPFILVCEDDLIDHGLPGTSVCSLMSAIFLSLLPSTAPTRLVPLRTPLPHLVGLIVYRSLFGTCTNRLPRPSYLLAKLEFLD